MTVANTSLKPLDTNGNPRSTSQGNKMPNNSKRAPPEKNDDGNWVEPDGKRFGSQWFNFHQSAWKVGHNLFAARCKSCRKVIREARTNYLYDHIVQTFPKKLCPSVSQEIRQEYMRYFF